MHKVEAKCEGDVRGESERVAGAGELCERLVAAEVVREDGPEGAVGTSGLSLPDGADDGDYKGDAGGKLHVGVEKVGA